VVLILDQFEEFLVHHAQTLDSLRDELAALVRAPELDAAVVLSLREEYLGGAGAIPPAHRKPVSVGVQAEALAEPDLRARHPATGRGIRRFLQSRRWPTS